MAEISVIVPVYKVQPYLKKCIDSILAQTFQDFEIILVDDGSPDKCGEICEEYASNFENITVIHQKNGGLSAARNSGIDWAFQFSHSKWIAFVDSDDYIKDNYLDVLYKASQKYKADLVISDFDPVDEEGKTIDENHVFELEIVDDNKRKFNLLYSNWRMSPAWTKLYSKELFRDLRFNVGKLHEDEFLVHQILWRAKRVVILPDYVYCYLIRKNGITGVVSPRLLLDSLESHLKRYDFCKEHSLPVDPRLFHKVYLQEVLNYDFKINEDKKRWNSLITAYKEKLLKEEKLLGMWKLLWYSHRK